MALKVLELTIQLMGEMKKDLEEPVIKSGDGILDIGIGGSSANFRGGLNGHEGRDIDGMMESSDREMPSRPHGAMSESQELIVN